MHSNPLRILASREVHVWVIECSGEVEHGSYDLLCRAERKRADAFRFPEHRRRFVQAHAALRQILHLYTAVPAEAVEFGQGDRGKPFLLTCGAARSLHFNLAHSGELALVALAEDGELGVDIEKVRSIPDRAAIAGRFFHRAEEEWIRAALPDRSAEAFFRIWTAKEAYIKANGLGLSHPLTSFSVVGSAVQQEYVITPLKLPEGYVGAVAHRPPVYAVREFRWNAAGGDRNP